MKKYVVGFMFSTDLQFVALIRKNRPEWQAGKLNGIGGKIEEDESPRDAMIREFYEETGVLTASDDWTISGRIGEEAFDENEFQVYVLKAVSNKVFDVKTTTDEKVMICFADNVAEFNETVSNLRAIVPALLLPDLKGFYFTY
jgi:8-oxo-dGTP diphosphatase